LGGAAGQKILNTIDRSSPIDIESSKGETPETCTGSIEFSNIKLAYPSRRDAVVLDDFSLRIPPGQMTAIVGPSGSGKSSIIGLLERFYLPLEGHIFLDGHDITSLQLRWLRNQLSLVGQEPTLFADTVFNNIAFGLVGTQYENVGDNVMAIVG
jgi:ATP-binding cassette, subfamily B (MDR/TAP), member 1